MTGVACRCSASCLNELNGASVFCAMDHRIAMAMSIAGINASGVTDIPESDCVNVSYPGFFETINSIKQKQRVIN